MLLSKSINYMPDRLKAFKKYIEKYDCTYIVAPGNDEDETNYALIFYKEDKPYIMVCQHENSNWATIYVNHYGDDWSKSDCPVRPENLISNDMKQFIYAIRECKESEVAKPKKTRRK